MKALQLLFTGIVVASLVGCGGGNKVEGGKVSFTGGTQPNTDPIKDRADNYKGTPEGLSKGPPKGGPPPKP